MASSTAPRCVVLTHVYNEEYLMPWWLEHHARVFDHGIVVDHGSTDATAAIVRRVCPTWEVRRTRTETFGAAETDAELMDLEASLPEGTVKMVLTVTEFLMVRGRLADAFAGTEPRCVGIKPLAAVGQVAHPRSLAELLGGVTAVCPTARPGHRFVHSHATGRYGIGRHVTVLPWEPAGPDGPFLLWLGFYPWNDAFRARKAQIKDRIPQSDYARGLSYQHAWTLERQEEQKRRIEATSVPVAAFGPALAAALAALARTATVTT